MTCGTQSNYDAKFCSQCGTAFSVVCSRCNSANLPFFQFCAACGQALNAAAEPKETGAPVFARGAGLTAERRQLTVMFCDLSGSTLMATQLDPEDLYNLMARYRAAAAEVVTEFGGTIAQYLGDGILAFFGYPAASETDAECAVRAGLEIVHRTVAVETRGASPLMVRVGIATGLVVVGGESGPGKDNERSAAGEALNLAARLQSFAPENGVLIADSTRRLVGNIFELEEITTPSAKGFGGALKAFRVGGVSAVENRFEALRLGERTEFVGRDEEIALLLRRWRQILQGEGRIVLLQGDPGIGKSRIVDQFSAMLRGGDHHNLCVYGSPLRSQTALFPVLRQLKREAGISNAQDDADKLAAVTRLFAGVAGPQDQAARLIAGLLGVKGAEVEGLSAVQRRERTIAALLDYLSALARQKPLLLIFEDTHWMDPTSLDLLDRIVAQIEPQRILLLVCARPDYQPAWADYAAVTSLSLNRLGVREGAAMIDSIARRKALPASLAAQILDRSDGVPLFIEELTKSVLESGALIEQADGYALRGSLPAATLPGSLQASLVARLDRLPAPAKQLAQLGAVIGREFSQRVLQDVTELSRDAMEDCLAKLIASGLIHRRGRGQDARYIFKHALIQDAAYSTLLKGRRQEIHAAIARALLEKYPAVANAQPEVLAHHLTCAADYAPAVQFWLAAGRMQIRSSADLEGIQHLQRGLELVDYVNDPGLRRELELMLHAALIGPLVAVEGANSPRVAVACERGLALIPAGSPYIFPFTYGQFTHLVSTGQLGQALDVAQRFTTLAEQAGYEPGAVIGHRLRGMALLGLGRLQAARETLETSLALYDPDRDDNITYLFGQNAKVNCQAVLSLTLYLLGEEDRAKQIGQDAIRTANRLKHPHSMAIAISYFGCWVLALCGERAEMARQAERLVIIAEEYGLRALGVVGQFFVAWAQYLGGGGSAAIGAMESFIHRLDETGFRLSLSQFIGLLADAQLASGRLTEARASCNWAKQMMEDTDERWFEPELICLDAQIAYAAGEIGRDEAAARFQAGADCARRLSSPPLEERCKRRLQTALASQMA